MAIKNNTSKNTFKDIVCGDNSFFMEGADLALCGEEFGFKHRVTCVCSFNLIAMERAHTSTCSFSLKAYVTGT